MPRGVGGAEISIAGGAQLERVIKALREVGDGGLARELSAELRKAARPMVPKVRAAIMAIPSNHDGTLRREMSAATRAQFRVAGSQAGITIRVDGRRMPAGKRSLPSYMEGRKGKPWRHPVYGNTNVWVAQPVHTYFYKTVEPLGRDVKRNMDAVASRIARKLNG